MSADKRLSFLKNQFSKIDDNTFETIVSSDPTQEKKYSTWLLRLYSKSNLNLNDLPTLNQVIGLHLSLKENIPVEFRDINKFESVISFLHSMNVWFTNRFVENEKNINYLKNGGELIFENENVSIIKIISYEGSIAYGSGTKWCTLQADSYHNYAKKGNLYIVTPVSDFYKKIFGKKSQLHFGNTEFRSHNNDELDLIESIIACPELYEPIKKIQSSRDSSELGKFFAIKECASSLVCCVKTRGYRVLSFVEKLSKEFIDALFLEMGEEAYEFIPDSREKFISFVTSIENGLKKLLKEGNAQIDEEIFRKSVISYPENILLMSCNDESLWEYAVMNESWLVNKSPFINDGNKLLPLVRENVTILKYIVPVKVFTKEQIEQIAENLAKDCCENYLEYLPCLGELSEKSQLTLVKVIPESVKYFVCPSDKAIKLSQKLIQEKQEEEEKLRKVAEQAAKNRKKSIEHDSDFMQRILGDFYKQSGTYERSHDMYEPQYIAEKWMDSNGRVCVRKSDGNIYYSDFKSFNDCEYDD